MSTLPQTSPTQRSHRGSALKTVIPTLWLSLALLFSPASATARPNKARPHATQKRHGSKRIKRHTKRRIKKRSKRTQAHAHKRTSKKTKRYRGPKRTSRKTNRHRTRKIAHQKQRKTRAARLAKARHIKAMRKMCSGRNARRSKKCSKFNAAEKERNRKRIAARDAKYCRGRSHKRTKRCRHYHAVMRKKTLFRRFCGQKIRRARRGDTVARFARRYRVAPGLVRAWNHLGQRNRLKRGRRYIAWRPRLAGQKLHDGQLLVAEPGLFTIQRPQRGWGKAVTVQAIRNAAIAARGGNMDLPQLIVGDLSKKGGGCLPPHKSHRGGLDVDIGYYQKDGVKRNWMTMTNPRNIDAKRTWTFLKSMLTTKRLQLAFVDYRLQGELYKAARLAGETTTTLAKIMQYPHSRSNKRLTILRHLKGHADHMHLRFLCPPGHGCALNETTLAAMRAVGQPKRQLAQSQPQPDAAPPAGPAHAAPPSPEPEKTKKQALEKTLRQAMEAATEQAIKRANKNSMNPKTKQTVERAIRHAMEHATEQAIEDANEPAEGNKDDQPPKNMTTHSHPSRARHTTEQQIKN